MPRAERTAVYGAEYEQLLLQAFHNTTHGEWQIPVIRPAAFKARVYAYFQALRKENLNKELIQMAESLSMRTEVVDDQPNLVFYRRRDSWDAQLIRAALNLEKGFEEVSGGSALAPPTIARDLRTELAELRARNEKK